MNQHLFLAIFMAVGLVLVWKSCTPSRIFYLLQWPRSRSWSTLSEVRYNVESRDGVHGRLSS